MGLNWDDRAAFCCVCGAPLEERDAFGARRRACTSCDYIQFRSPACAAAALVARGREVLFVRRGIEPYCGEWGLPAGYQEYWESAEEAAIREVREETGLEIAILRLLDVWYTKDDPRKRSNVSVYLARPVAGTLSAADDAADARFFTLDKLPDKVAFENNRRLLSRLVRDQPVDDIQ